MPFRAYSALHCPLGLHKNIPDTYPLLLLLGTSTWRTGDLGLEGARDLVLELKK